jgi:hypothetical protein
MNVDELRRGLDDAGRRPGIDLVDARAAVGAKTVHRRRRNRRLLVVATVAAVAAIAIPVARLRDDPGRKLRVAPQPIDQVDGWAAIRKTTAGLAAGSSFSAIASTDHSLLLAGALPGGTYQPAIWYSNDGFTWARAEVPATGTGTVQAIAARDDTALAIGSDGLGRSPFVWRSGDNGRTWETVAQGEGLFGPAATDMGRPFVDGLMYAYGKWIASGGASSGYAGVWTSVDGEQWQQVLDTRPDTGVGGVSLVVDARDAHVLAYGGNAVWESSDGTNWGDPVIASVLEPYYLGTETVAPGATIAFGENKLKHGQPTPLLLRIADRGQAWAVENTFLEQFPTARVLNVIRERDLWVASGWSGAKNHPDAWVSADGSSWRSLPRSLYGEPGGTLSLAGAVGGRIVFFGTAPELDRYYTLDVPRPAPSPTDAREILRQRSLALWKNTRPQVYALRFHKQSAFSPNGDLVVDVTGEP